MKLPLRWIFCSLDSKARRHIAPDEAVEAFEQVCGAGFIAFDDLEKGFNEAFFGAADGVHLSRVNPIRSRIPSSHGRYRN